MFPNVFLAHGHLEDPNFLNFAISKKVGSHLLISEYPRITDVKIISKKGILKQKRNVKLKITDLVA